MTASVLVIADDPAARQRLHRQLRDITRDVPLRTALSASDEALEEARRLGVDVVVVDGRPEETDGPTLWRALASLHPAPVFVFIGFVDNPQTIVPELRVAARLNRPVRRDVLADVLRDAAGGQAAPAVQSAARFVSVAERGRVLHVPIEDVVYLKAELKYVTVRTREREYLTDASLLMLDAAFPGVFLRIHRNALIARHAIVGIERVAGGSADHEAVRQVVLDGVPERLPVSRLQWAAVKAVIEGHLVRY